MAEGTSGHCTWCGKPSFAVIQRQNGEGLPVCADHYISLQSVENERQRNLTDQARHAMAMMNLAVDEMTIATGVNLGGKVAIPTPTPANNVNNINVTNSTIGVLNTATVGQISAYVGHMPASGAKDALAHITSAVAKAEITDPEKKNLLDQIEVIAEQAASEPPKRKPAVVGAILSAIKEAAGATTAIAGTWSAVEPVLRAHFGLA